MTTPPTLLPAADGASATLEARLRDLERRVARLSQAGSGAPILARITGGEAQATQLNTWLYSWVRVTIDFATSSYETSESTVTGSIPGVTNGSKAAGWPAINLFEVGNRASPAALDLMGNSAPYSIVPALQFDAPDQPDGTGVMVNWTLDLFGWGPIGFKCTAPGTFEFDQGPIVRLRPYVGPSGVPVMLFEAVNPSLVLAVASHTP